MEGSKYIYGPDQIIPAENETSVALAQGVKLRIPKSGKPMEVMKPKSVPGVLQDTVRKFPDTFAYCYKENGIWVKVTYKKYLEEIRATAKAFLHLGLEKHHSVGILGFNSPQWFLSYLGAIFAGGVSVGIYTTNSSEACFHCADLSKANIIVVEDKQQLAKIEAIRDRLPHLKAVIQYEGEPTNPNVLSWKRLMQIGEEQSDDVLDKALRNIAINDCCSLVFTSGTTAKPKAVMLSHDNLTWDAVAIAEGVGCMKRGSEVIVSYLPLSHVAGQEIDINLSYVYGATVYFADRNALKGSLLQTLQEVQPTKFLAVPRVWEKFHEKLEGVIAQNGKLKKGLFEWARNQATQEYSNRMKGSAGNSWGYKLACALVLNKVKQAIGFSRCNAYYSGAAPLSPEIKKFFLSIDIPVMECFGMSESGGGHAMGIPTSFDVETLGKSLPGTRTKLGNIIDGCGEICMYGRHIFMGYLNERKCTDEVIDSEGWLCSGDLGRIDSEGFIYLTGRSKEIVITAGGENVAPVPIEQRLEAALPHISFAVLIGEKRKFLSVLVTLKTVHDAETSIPTDVLTKEVQNWLKELGCPAKTVTEVLKAGPDPKLTKALQDGVNKTNEKAISNAQKIQKFRILPADFSIPTGELGPTQKLKRTIVTDKYIDIIDGIYA